MNDDNKYNIVDEIAQGGQAIINKVVHKEYGYTRALRRLHGIRPIFDKNDPVYLKFVEECKLLLRIGNGSHPNILKISQPILIKEAPAVEMELLIGRDVFESLALEGYYSTSKTIQLLKDISSALAYCHVDIYRYCMNPNDDTGKVENKGKLLVARRGKEDDLINKYKVIHNDIHSKNIFFSEDGRFILLDFGLSFEGSNIVRSSHKHGVEAYKAPEKFDTDTFIPTEQSDIYSFGILLYESLAGDVPFPDIENASTKQATELQDKRKRINNEPIPDIFQRRKLSFTQKGKNLNEKDYPQWLEDTILKCLAKNPKDRFKNGKELQTHVLKCIEEQTQKEKELLITKAKKEENEKIQSLITAKDKEIEELKAKEDKGFDIEKETLLQQIQDLEKKKTTFENDWVDTKNVLVKLKKEHSELFAEYIKLINQNNIYNNEIKRLELALKQEKIKLNKNIYDTIYNSMSKEAIIALIAIVLVVIFYFGVLPELPNITPSTSKTGITLSIHDKQSSKVSVQNSNPYEPSSNKVSNKQNIEYFRNIILTQPIIPDERELKPFVQHSPENKNEIIKILNSRIDQLRNVNVPSDEYEKLLKKVELW